MRLSMNVNTTLSYAPPYLRTPKPIQRVPICLTRRKALELNGLQPEQLSNVIGVTRK